jgi:hypothetical protein
MAKYNWQELEKEYILGDYKNVTVFLKEKNIPNNGSTRKQTTGWGDKKRQKQEKVKTKTIQKVIEKTSTQDSNKILNIKDTAEELLKKINTSIEELDRYIAKTTTKTKKVKYDYKAMKPEEEVTTEENVINEYKAIIDRNGLKQLTSALKDINDIIGINSGDNDNEKVVIVNDLPK